MVSGYDLWMQEKKRRADADMDLESTDLNTIPELREKVKLTQSGVESTPQGDEIRNQLAPDQGGAKTMAPQVQGGSDISSMIMAGGMNSANPTMIAAGAGLSVLSNIQKQKQQEERDKYNARVAKNQRQRNAITNLIQVGQGMRL